MLVDTEEKKRILGFSCISWKQEMYSWLSWDREAQLHSWNNNVFEFLTSESFPGTNWNLLAKQDQQWQELFQKLCFFTKLTWRSDSLTPLTGFFTEIKMLSNLDFQCFKQEFRQLFCLALLSLGSSGSSRYPCFRFWIYTLWQGTTAPRQS